MKSLTLLLRGCLLLAAGSPASLTAASETYHSPIDTAYSPDGATIAVADTTKKTVVLMDAASGKTHRIIPLTSPPAGLTWTADSQRIFVAESGASRVTEINPATGAINRHFTTGRYPQGLAAVPNKNILLVCDWGLDRLTAIDTETGKTITHIPTGRQPTSVAVTQDGTLAVVSSLIPNTAATEADTASEVTIVDVQKLVVGSRLRLPTGSTNARGVAISPDGKTAVVVHTLGRFHLPTTQLDRGWVNTNAFSLIDLPAGKRIATLLLDHPMEGAADPWDVAMDPLGQRLYITLAGVHQLAIINFSRLPEATGPDPSKLENDLAALHRLNLIERIKLPAKGPRGVSVSTDGKQIAVAGYFSGNVVLLDANGGNPKSVPLGSQPEPDLVRRGEAAFHDADLCFQRWLSCATCHPDARADGLNWDLLNDGLGNPKNTRSMLLSHATPPVMSLGVREKMEVAVRAGFVHIQFTTPQPEVLDAVSAYLKSLKPAASPHLSADGNLTESAARGKEIFHRESVGCADCHPGPLFTDLSLGNVGTQTKLDPAPSGFDTPTLVELWRTAPYLHDGRAATLREVLLDHNQEDNHGTTSNLKPAEIEDLTNYVLSL